MHYPEIPERVSQLTRASIDVDTAAANGDVTRANRALMACKRIAARLGELHFCERHQLVPDEPNRYLDDNRTLELELESPLDDPADRQRDNRWVQLDQDERATLAELIHNGGDLDSSSEWVGALLAKLVGEPAPAVAPAGATTSDREALRAAMLNGASVVVWRDDDDRDCQAPGIAGTVAWINDREVRLFTSYGSELVALSRVARVMVDDDSEVTR